MNRKKIIEAREKLETLAGIIVIKPYHGQKRRVVVALWNALATLDAGLESRWRRWLRRLSRG